MNKRYIFIGPKGLIGLLEGRVRENNRHHNHLRVWKLGSLIPPYYFWVRLQSALHGLMLKGPLV